MSRKLTLANRTGKPYPHNAITEILSKGNPSFRTKAPSRFSKRVMNLFFKILELAPENTRKAYNVVYANGNSLSEAAKVLGKSSTTIARWLEYIYFVKDESGYLVAALDAANRESLTFTNPSEADYKKLVKWRIWVKKSASITDPKLTEDQMIAIMEACERGLDYTVIADFYQLSRFDVMNLECAENQPRKKDHPAGGCKAGAGFPGIC